MDKPNLPNSILGTSVLRPVSAISTMSLADLDVSATFSSLWMIKIVPADSVSSLTRRNAMLKMQSKTLMVETFLGAKLGLTRLEPVKRRAVAPLPDLLVPKTNRAAILKGVTAVEAAVAGLITAEMDPDHDPDHAVGVAAVTVDAAAVANSALSLW